MSGPVSSRVLKLCRSLNFYKKVPPQRTFPNGLDLDMKKISDSAVAVEEELPKELLRLAKLDRVYINQLEVIKRAVNVNAEGKSSKTLSFEVNNRANEVLLKIEFARGSLQDYLINVFGPGEGDDKPVLAEMNLERSFKYKGFILRVNSPPGNRISSVIELPGFSRVAIIHNKDRTTILQILTNGGFGWSTSAKILNGSGSKKIGTMYTMKSKSAEDANKANALHATIHFPTDLKVYKKLTLIGVCFTCMGRYHV